MLGKRNILITFLLLLMNILLPLNVFAYSDYILASGKNIGIELNSNGVLIVGTYPVADSDPARNANLKIGDKIISVNDNKVTSIDDFIKIVESLDDNTSLNIIYEREGATDRVIKAQAKINTYRAKTDIPDKETVFENGYCQ